MTDTTEACRQRRAIRRANGLCSNCNDAAAPGRSSCQKHLEQNRKAGRRYYEKRKATQAGKSA